MPGWYSVGTVTVTNGSAVVTGAGTDFVNNVSARDAFALPGGAPNEILSVQSATQLTLARPWLGASANAQAYTIQPTVGIYVDLALRALAMLNPFQAVLDGIGQGLIPSGTLAAPGIRFAADQDTGIYRAGENQLAIVGGGVTQMLFDASVGVTCPVPFAAQAGATSSRGGSVGATLMVHDFFGSAGGAATVRVRFGTAGNAYNGHSFMEAQTYTGATSDLRFGASGNVRLQITTANAVAPGVDNSQQLGIASLRWSAVYASTSAIQTSDEREKHWQGQLTPAHLRAARRVIDEIGLYQWLDAVSEKGEDGARVHVGPRAQRVMQIMIEEGLEEPSGDGVAHFRHAFLCYDRWDATPAIAEVRDEEGEIIVRAQPERAAGDRYGLRIDQLMMLLLAAHEHRLSAIEATLAAQQG